MSYRLGNAAYDEHNPMIRGIIDYNRDHAKKEQYGLIRGSNPNGIYDRKFDNRETYGTDKKPTLLSCVAVVIAVVIVIILIAYFIHLNRVDKNSDSEYFDQFTLWGSSNANDAQQGDEAEVISETPVVETIKGGDPTAEVDACSLVNDSRKSLII